MEITSNQCGDLLTTWLSKECSPDNAKTIAKNIGYNDSPFFGAKKKKTKLIGELVMVKVALVIYAVNQVFDPKNAKSIIDSFLSISSKSIFSAIEGQDPDFRNKYKRRMAQYFELLHKDNPRLGLSFAFLTNLNMDPLKNMKGQVIVSTEFGESLSETIDVLQRMKFRW